MQEISRTKEQLAEAKPVAWWKPWRVASIAAGLILAISLLLMYALGLFAIPRDDTGAKTLAAALGLVGVIISTVATLIGIGIKYSIDDRTAKQAEVEASRSHALAKEAEHRNRIDTTIRAVDLLGENNKDASPAQMGGALLALVNLGEIDLALALLAQLWPSRTIRLEVIRDVLREALNSASMQTQSTAADILNRNASNVEQAESFPWPILYNRWRYVLDDNSRVSLILAAVKWLKLEIKQIGNESLPSAAVVLYEAMNDPDVSISGIATASLKSVVKASPKIPGSYTPGGLTGTCQAIETTGSRI